MFDRRKLAALLTRRFPGATGSQIAAAANAIMGLEDEWEEVEAADDFGYNVSSRCADNLRIGTRGGGWNRIPRAAAAMRMSDGGIETR